MHPILTKIREAAAKADEIMGTNFKKKGGSVYRLLLKVWSLIRRIIDPAVIKLTYHQDTPIRLHLGCGSKRFQNYINVDLWITEATDVICNITKLPWPDYSVELIESYHVIEHISHRKIKNTLKEWYRVLKPGGRFIVECPHFDEAVMEYLEGNEDRLINIFGWQRMEGDIHLFGYNPQRLIHLLEEIGFTDFEESDPKSSQAVEEPSFRIECKKPS